MESGGFLAAVDCGTRRSRHRATVIADRSLGRYPYYVSERGRARTINQAHSSPVGLPALGCQPALVVHWVAVEEAGEQPTASRLPGHRATLVIGTARVRLKTGAHRSSAIRWAARAAPSVSTGR
jgi:hypothetical protein